jgi:ribose transport system substrate-binding protein
LKYCLCLGSKLSARAYAALLACVCIALTLIACDGKSSSSEGAQPAVHKIAADQTVRLAFVPNAPAAFWEMAEHGLKKFEKETGVHVELKYPPTGSVEEQNRILEDLANQNYSGVALSVIAPEDQIREINRATERMNVITTDSDAPHSRRIAFVGPKQSEAGTAAGNEIVKLLPNGGDIAVFCGDLTAENAVERMTGIKSAIAGKSINIVAVKEDGKDRTRARAQVEDVINAYPRIALLVGLWSYNGPAIRDALVSSDQTGKIQAVTFDEEQGTLEGIQSGVIAATVVLTPFDYGYRSAKLLYDLARQGEPAIPPGSDIDTGYKVIHATDLSGFRALLAEQGKW